MKRIIALLLAMVMLLGMFAGCKKQEPDVIVEDPTVPTEESNYDENLEKALEYLRVFYKDTPEKTAMDYTRIGTVRVGESVYDIVWTVELPEGADPNTIQVVINEDGSVTIDINEDIIWESTEEVPYTLTATLTGTDGRVVTYSWELIVPPGLDEEAMAIVDAAYALAPGEALDGLYTLTGEIISIDEMYSEQYSNITVTMVVRGREDFPIKCYRLKGAGCDMLAVGDRITVTGSIKNYKGTIEFDAGCILEAVESGGGTPPTAPEDPLEILQQAYALKSGQSLPYKATLTGVITDIKYPWNEQYPTPTFTIVVQGQTGMPIYCYKVEGNETWLKSIEVTDTVTLTGGITNYQGTVEFNRPTMTYWEKGPGLTQALNYGYMEEGVAYKMYMDQNTLGQTYYFTGSAGSYLNTSTSASKGVDMYMEKVAGSGVRFYFMDGETKTYVEIYLNDAGKPRPRLTTSPSIVYNYSNTAKTYCVMLESQEYYLGTYSTYTTISASSTYYITGENAYTAGVSQFIAKFVKSSEVDTGEEEEETTPGVLTGAAMTGAPANGDVVVITNGTNAMTTIADGSKLGPESVTIADDGTLTGTSNLAQLTVSIDDNGYYTFTTPDGKYLTSGATGNSLSLNDAASDYSLWIVEDAGNGSYYIKSVNAKFGTNTQSMEYYSGFTTYGHKDTEIYQMQFYTVVSVTEGSGSSYDIYGPLSEGTAYNLYMRQAANNKDLFFTGAMDGSYLGTTETAADAAVVYMEKVEGEGVRFYTLDGGTKTYIEVFLNEDLKPRPALNTTASVVFTYDNEVDTYVVTLEDSDYYLGTHGTYDTISASSTYYITEDNASLVGVSQFVAEFIVPGNIPDHGGDDNDDVTGTVGVGTLLTTAPADGDVIVIANGTNFMTGTASGTKLAAEPATVTEGKVDVTEKMAQLTVSIDANGYYTFTSGGKYLTSGETGNSLTLADAASDYSLWTVESAGEGLWYIKNVNAAYTNTATGVTTQQSLEYYSGFTTYGHKDTEIYQMQLFTVEAIVASTTTGTLMTTAPVDGDVLVVYNSGNAMTGTASGTKLAGEPATVTDGVLPVTEAMAQLTVSVDANGYYTFTSGGKYLTSGETGNSLTLADAASDYSLWTVESAGDGLWYIKNVNAAYTNTQTGVTTQQSLEFYSGFTTYGHKDTEIYQMQLFKVQEGAETPDEPDVPDVPDTPEVPEATTATLMAAAPVNGDFIVIANGAEAMTGTASGTKLEGEEVVIEEGVLTLTDTLAILQVTVDANGYYTFTTADGKYLTSDSDGGNLTLEDAASDYSLWNVVSAGENLWYIKNVNAKSGSRLVSMRFSVHKFSTYYDNTTSGFQMSLYKVGGEAEEETPETVTVADGTYAIVYAAGGKALTALAAGSSYGNMPATVVTLTDGVLSGHDNSAIFQLTNNDDGSFTLVDNYDRLVYMSGTYNNFNVTAASSQAGSAWVLEDAGNGCYYVKNVEKAKYITFDSDAGTFGAYETAAEGSVMMLVPVTKAEEEPEVTFETAEELLNAAYGLEEGVALAGIHTLTGVVTEITYPYQSGYSTISCWIVVDGLTEMPILCYKLSGDEIANVAVGDTITVKGAIINYQGTIEFNTCALLARVAAAVEEAAIVPEEEVLVEEPVESETEEVVTDEPVVEE